MCQHLSVPFGHTDLTTGSGRGEMSPGQSYVWGPRPLQKPYNCMNMFNTYSKKSDFQPINLRNLNYIAELIYSVLQFTHYLHLFDI
jgi:hypothetical protein